MSHRAHRSEAGFTLIELLVSLAVTSVLILGVLATFDFTARMNRVQMHVADMQQSLRIAQNEVVRFSRMAGRGSLPANLALQVTNNVPAGTTLVPAEAATEILADTDVVRVRGVLSSTVYQIDTVNPSAVFGWSDVSGTGWAIVFPTAQGVPQDLVALENLLTLPDKATRKDSLVLLDGSGRVAAVKVEKAFKDGVNLRVEFKKHPNQAVLGIMSSDVKKLVSLGVLEEYAFYVRAQGGESPTLARARLEPGSSQAYDDDGDGTGDLENATMDLADNILDLQAAYAVGVAGQPELRVTTLARTDRADPGRFTAPLLPATIEDHAYPANHPYNSVTARRYRWRLLRTDLNLRNI
jgi:prepilin-type N-terminal cleavage/methylation domain-containing protein